MKLAALLLLSTAIHAEIVDRVAVTVGNSVVTLSEVLIQARVTALIEGVAPRFDGPALRLAADRRVEQILLRREMILGDYAPAGTDSAQALLDSLKRDRFRGNADAYRKGLVEYGVTEEELLDQLQWQVTLLRFIELRFRPGVQVPGEDIAAYYRETFLPSWTEAGTPPPLEDVSDRIEMILATAQLNNLVDRWLNATRSQLDIQYREDAFRDAEDPQ